MRGLADLSGGFSAIGEVRLTAATIGGQLKLSGAALSNAGNLAFSGEGIETGSAFLDKGFSATGEVRLSRARIRDQLEFVQATLANDSGIALALEDAHIGALWLKAMPRPEGVIDLIGTQVGTLVADEQSWPEPGRLLLDRFTYRSIEDELGDLDKQIKWLELHGGGEGRPGRITGFFPGPYEQLISVYRAQGDDKAVRKLAIEKERARLKRGKLPWPTKVWKRFLGLTVGYGYRPEIALMWLLFLMVFASVTFLLAGRQGVMVPTDLSVSPTPKATECTPNYPCFCPVLYALDVLLPFPEIGQQDNWRPDASRRWGEGYRAATWGLPILSIALVTAIGAAVTRVLRRE